VDPHGIRGLVPSLLLSCVVVLVALGLGHGVWLENLHNGLLALAFTGVGAYVLLQRPRHREGLLFLATGLVEAVMFYGRQVGHAAPAGFSAGATSWWAWLGVWPLAIGLALTTVSVILFPDGRLPSPRWRWVVTAVLALAGLCSALSALWPVEYAAAGVATPHPIDPGGSDAAAEVWQAIAHPAYAAFQLLWVLAVVVRWRRADGHVRQQLLIVLVAAAASVLALSVGLAGWGTPRAGLLTAALVPLAAGWSIVHGQNVAAYSALSWLSRTRPGTEALPTSMARAAAEALSAPATLWMGSADRLLPVGVWPERPAAIGATPLSELCDRLGPHLRTVSRDGVTLGALTVDRSEPLTGPEAKLLGDLAAQATLVIEHVTLADVLDDMLADGTARPGRAARLEGLTPREHDVLELMARGLSNAAICAELHLSIKTVEPVVSAIFAKLGLQADSDSNRRVLAVLAFLRT
jgi:DNA-binding CsgD family transcriptional regulator